MPVDQSALVESVFTRARGSNEPAARVFERALSPDCDPARLMPEQRVFREQLGLPVDRPVFMSGHQAEIWHPGIAAKYLALLVAADAEAERAPPATTPTLAWLVVDQDDNDPTMLRYPKHDARPGVWRLAREAVPAPTGQRPKLSAAALAGVVPPPDALKGSVPDGLQAVRAALEAGAQELTPDASLAAQVWHAVERCPGLREAGDPPVRAVYATCLARTDLFRAMVGAMLADPARCARAYNEAAASHPRARLRSLEISPDGSRCELPLWELLPGAPRRSVFVRPSGPASSLNPDTLAPKALCMTALLRLAGCEVFVHGVGGGVYDLAMEAWVWAWLGDAELVGVRAGALAPTVVVSATVRLAGRECGSVEEGAALLSPEEVDRAAWVAHAARFDPGMLGDSARGAEKQAILDAMRAGRGSSERRALYLRMHALLAASRAEHAGELHGFETRAADARGQRARAAVLLDRTYPFPLYGAGVLGELRAGVRRGLLEYGAP